MNSSSIDISRTPRRAGFLHGLRQPSTSFALTLTCPASINWAALDDWLRHLEADIGAPQAPASALDQRSQAQVAAQAWRVLQLGAALLRAARVPAFSPGCLLGIAPQNRLRKPQNSDSQVWEIQVAVPCIDLLPEQFHLLAYQTSAMALRWMMGRPRTPGNMKKLHGYLQASFLGKFQGSAVGGGSTIALLRAAWSENIPFRHLGRGVYQLGWGSKGLRVNRGAVQFDSAIGAKIAQDKWSSASLLRDAGLPAATHFQVSTGPEALAAARALGWPVVVKPLDRERGEGVTVAIDSESALADAMRKALTFSSRVLVEREVAGVCHRVLVARDEVIVVSKRRPKSVRGDGRHSVRELVHQANECELDKPRWSRLKLFPLDAPAMARLAAVGMTMDTVPPRDAWVPLRRIESSEDGGVVEDMASVIHPDNVAIAVKAARLFGLALAGIDIISPDIARPWHENGAIVNEVNYSSLLPGRHSAHVLPALLQRFTDGDGRIPVEAVLGGASALDEARRLRDGYAERGLRCHVTSHETTESAEGRIVPMVGTSLFARCIALSLDSQVDAIVMVIQGDELLRTGLPFDCIDRVTVMDGDAGPQGEACRALLARYAAGGGAAGQDAM